MATEYKLSYTASEIDKRLGTVANVVLYTAQNLTEEQKAQVRKNIGAADASISGTKIIANDLSIWNLCFESGDDSITYADGVLTVTRVSASNAGALDSTNYAENIDTSYPLNVSVNCNYVGSKAPIFYVEIDGNYSVNRVLTVGSNTLTFDLSDKTFSKLRFLVTQNKPKGEDPGYFSISDFEVSQTVFNLSIEEQVIENKKAIDELRNQTTGAEYVTKEYVDDLVGTGTQIVEDVYVDNAIALSSWNGCKIISSIDDEVIFTAETKGNRGVCKSLTNTIDATRPVYVKYTAKYPTAQKLFFNIFKGSNSLFGAQNTSNGTEVVHKIDLSSQDCSSLNFIIYSSWTESDVGQEISISGLRIYQEREEQVSRIVEHEARISDLEVQKNFFTAPNGEAYLLQVSVDGNLMMTPQVPSKALFIGNSLLIGFGTFGMAASDREHDYYHLINQVIVGKKSGYTASKMSGTSWESAITTETQTAFLNNTLLPELSEDLDLVIVQLGDNVNTDAKKAVFADGCRSMLEFIRTNAPKARVAWVGAWYQTAEKQSQMAEACRSTGCTFIDIWDLATSENRSAIGNTYTDSSGNVQTITSAGVASHPGDSGFKAIANRVLYKLGIVDVENYYK